MYRYIYKRISTTETLPTPAGNTNDIHGEYQP